METPDSPLDPPARLGHGRTMLGAPLPRALDKALQHSVASDLSEAERLALATYWLVDRIAVTTDLTPEDAAASLTHMATLAAEHLGKPV